MTALLAETLEEESSGDDELTSVAAMLQSQCAAGADENPDSDAAGSKLARPKTSGEKLTAR